MFATGLRYFFAYDADIPPGLGVPNFSPTHWAWLSVTLLLIALAALAYRRASEPGRQRALRVAAVVLVALEVARTVWAVSIGHYHVERMLPLHLCGIAVFVEAAAVFTGRRVLKEFSYAVGMPGAFMALVTPEPSGYPLFSFQYLQSIAGHALLVLIPLLWLVGDGFRPDARYLPRLFGILLVIAGVDAVVNLVLGSNYLFISRAPADTPIELFDAWVGHPGYVGILALVVLLVWIAMYLPWTLAGRRRAAGAAERSGWEA